MLESVKLLLGIEDSLQDELLNLIIEDSEQRILSTVNQFATRNGTEPIGAIPAEFTYIHRDVAIKRFNKRNSEGSKSDSEEGRSYTWESSYLDEYLELFNEHTKPKIRAGMGVMRFI